MTDEAEVVFVAPVEIAGGDPLSTGAVIDVADSAALKVFGGLNLASANGLGTVSAAGPGSLIEVNAGTIGDTISRWGAGGRTGEFQVSDFAHARVFGKVELAVDDTIGTLGIISVESGADLVLDNLDVATRGGLVTTGKIRVDGNGSTMEISDTLDVGHADSGSAEIVVQNGATFQSGDGTSTFREHSLLRIDDSEFLAHGPMQFLGTTVNLLGSNARLQNSGQEGTTEQSRGAKVTVTDGATLQWAGEYRLKGLGTQLDVDETSSLRFVGPRSTSHLTISDNALCQRGRRYLRPT